MEKCQILYRQMNKTDQTIHFKYFKQFWHNLCLDKFEFPTFRISGNYFLNIKINVYNIPKNKILKKE